MPRLIVMAAAATLVLPAAAEAQDRRVRVINNSSNTIYQVHGTNTGNHRWGPDRLGSAVILSGHSRILNFDDGSERCMYDLKAVDSDGNEVTNMGANVCRIVNWTIND